MSSKRKKSASPVIFFFKKQIHMIEHISYRQGLTLVKGMKSILMEIPLDKEKFGLSRLMCAPQLYAHLEFKSNNIHRLN